MATSSQIRVVGIELAENVAVLKAAVDAVDAVTSAWVLNDVDGSLPTDLQVQAQLVAYEAIQKQANSMTDAIAAIRAAE